MKVLNVDEFLRENSVKVVVNGKEYTVKDIPLSVQDCLKEDNVDLRQAAALLLGCDKGELSNYEVVALSKIVRFVQESLLGEAMNLPKEV